MSEIKILGENILVEKLESEKVGEIILASQEKEDSTLKAKVISYGEDVININKNYIVYFKKYAATEITLNNKNYLMIKYSDIFAVEEV